MTETTDRRRGNRIAIHLQAFYYFGQVDRTGALANISYSGALIEGTTMRPKIGTAIILQVFLEPPGAFKAATPFELAGHVVRHSPNGFAIEYDESIDPDVRRMVDDAAAVVAVPR